MKKIGYLSLCLLTLCSCGKNNGETFTYLSAKGEIKSGFIGDINVFSHLLNVDEVTLEVIENKAISLYCGNDDQYKNKLNFSKETNFDATYNGKEYTGYYVNPGEQSMVVYGSCSYIKLDSNTYKFVDYKDGAFVDLVLDSYTLSSGETCYKISYTDTKIVATNNTLVMNIAVSFYKSDSYLNVSLEEDFFSIKPVWDKLGEASLELTWTK